jgi:hypothetical protein
MDFYGVEVRLCRYYRAQTKGKVESGVKYVKRNALAGRRFADLEALNAWLLEWCLAVADERVHGTTHERPQARFARQEASTLVAVGHRLPPPRERVESRIVPRDGYVTVATNRYPVPVEWVGCTVQAQLLAEEVVLRMGEAETVRYRRLQGKHELAHWADAPRVWRRPEQASVAGPPRWDPAYLEMAGVVVDRPLTQYAEAAR